MKINWKVRFKNPVFWRNILIAFIAPVLTYMGINMSDLTTWQAVFDVLKQAVMNPVILVSVLVSVWNALNASTSSGDSEPLESKSSIEPK